MITEAFLKSHVFDYKNEITKTPYIVDAAAFTGEEEGRFDVDFNSVMLECFVKSSEVKRLFVFFTSAGVRKSTVFHRISWSNKLNGMCLYIEDPMFKKYEGIYSGWYYGSNSESYLLLILKMVEKICHIKNIDKDDVYFTGSSAAGYSAIFCAENMEGTTAYAYNPPLVLNKSPYASNFKNKTGIDIEDQDKFKRNNLFHIQNNKKSCFLIFFNSFSRRDQLHYKDWMKSINLPITDGLHIHNGIHLFLKNINNSDPHTCVANLDDFIFMLSLKAMDNHIKYNLVESYLNRFKSYILTEESNYYKKILIKFMRNKIPPYLNFVEDETLNQLNYEVRGIENVRYKLECFKLKKNAVVSLIINRNEKILNPYFIEKLKMVCEDHKIRLVDNAKLPYISINKTIMNIDLIYEDSIDFIKKTYEEILSYYLILNMIELNQSDIVNVEQMKAYMNQIIMV